MHRTLTLALVTFFAALAVACGGSPSAPGTAAAATGDCKQPAAGEKTCGEGCAYDAATSACLPTRGVIIENTPVPKPAPTQPRARSATAAAVATRGRRRDRARRVVMGLHEQRALRIRR